jgi:hypothetical protein
MPYGGIPTSSSQTSQRHKHTITGLTNGAEYTVRVIATNAGGDSGPSPEATGTPQSTPGQPRLFVDNEVVKIHENSFPWLRETWTYITDQDVSVEFNEGSLSVVITFCNPFPRLYPCEASSVAVD